MEKAADGLLYLTSEYLLSPIYLGLFEVSTISGQLQIATYFNNVIRIIYIIKPIRLYMVDTVFQIFVALLLTCSIYNRNLLVPFC